MSARLMTAIATLVVAMAVILGVAGPAHAAGYRYWTYWLGGTGSWAFAMAGPASTIPADGSVEGWRFAVSTTVGTAVDAPRIDASFDVICGSTPSRGDRKRVALVLDFGSASIAPQGQTPPAPLTTCVVAETDATGYQVLRSVATIRTDAGLICAIADYPTGECATIVEDLAEATASVAPPSASPATTTPAVALEPRPVAPSSGAPWLTAAVIAFLAIVGLVLWTRRRHD